MKVLIVSPLDAIIPLQEKSLTRKGLQAIHVKSSNDTEVMAQIVAWKFHFILTSPELLLTNYDWTDVFQRPSKECYMLSRILLCYLTPCVMCTFITWLLQLIKFHRANFINNSLPRRSFLLYTQDYACRYWNFSHGILLK